MQSWIDDLGSSCGPLTGAAQRYVRDHGLAADPPRGVAALRHLIATLDAEEMEAAAAETHRNYVESAGAFFGLVLADQLRQAGPVEHVEHEGAHGLRLGAHGFLDPFGDVAGALAADDRSEALIAAVAHAEAEAQDRSAPTRVVRELVRQLSESDLAVTRRFNMRVWLQSDDANLQGDIEVDIGPLVDVSRGESEATLRRAVGKVVSTLLGRKSEILEWSVASCRILPRLVGDTFVRRLDAGGAGSVLCLEQLAGELRVAFIIDHGGRARFVRRSEVDAWSLAPGEVHHTALGNLAGRSSRARLLHVDHAQGTLVVGNSRDGLDAARLLLPGLYPLLCDDLGPDVVAAVPHRDLLLACSGADAEAVADLRRRTETESRRAPHAISAQLFRLDAGGLTVRPTTA